MRLYELASISTKKTGLALKIWVSTKSNSQHSAKIKVSALKGDKIKYDKLFTITIEDEPRVIGKNAKEVSVKEIQQVKDFIVSNKNALLKFWNEDIAADELAELLKPIRK